MHELKADPVPCPKGYDCPPDVNALVTRLVEDARRKGDLLAMRVLPNGWTACCGAPYLAAVLVRLPHGYVTWTYNAHCRGFGGGHYYQRVDCEGKLARLLSEQECGTDREAYRAALEDFEQR